MSLFDDIDGSLQAAMDQVFGEAIRVLPQRVGGNYGAGGSDLARPARDSRAIVSRASREGTVDFANTNRAGVTLSLAPSECWMDRAAYTALGYPIRRGDVIELTEKGDARVTVSDVAPGDHRDVVIHFTAGAPAQ